MKKIIFITFILLIISGCGHKGYEYYRDLALQSNNEGKYEEAIQASEKCIEINDDTNCWVHKAFALYSQNKCTDAVLALYHASMKEPDNEFVNSSFAMIYRDPKCTELNKTLEDIANKKE